MNKLKSMYIEVTSVCNMNCPYCYNNSGCKGTYLDKKYVFDLIDQCYKNKISEITISGGEPFLHPNIMDFIKYANNKQIHVRIISNLSTIKTDTAIEILKHGNYFQLTLDSTDEKENDSIRGKGCYKKIIELLEKAKKVNLSKRIVLRMNLSKKNVNKIDSFINLSIFYGVKHVSIAFIANCGRGQEYEYAFSYQHTLSEMIGIMEKLKVLSIKLKETIDISYNNLEEQRSCPLFNLGDIEINPRIDPNGNVFFCGYFFGEENSLGNISNNSVDEIINSKDFHCFKEKVQKRKQNNKCEVCLFNKICSCGCPAISFMNTNNIFNIDNQCKMIKYFIKNNFRKKRGLLNNKNER